MTDPKILEMAKKLQALATSNDNSAEADTAMSFLNAYLKKHKIEITDLESDILKKYYFWDDDLFFTKFTNQIIASVVGGIRSYHIMSDAQRRKLFPYKKGYIIELECTQIEHAEISTTTSILWPVWKKQLDLFWTAFVQKNKIFSKDSIKVANLRDNGNDEYSIMKFMDGIPNVKIRKQIE